MGRIPEFTRRRLASAAVGTPGLDRSAQIVADASVNANRSKARTVLNAGQAVSGQILDEGSRQASIETAKGKLALSKGRVVSSATNFASTAIRSQQAFDRAQEAQRRKDAIIDGVRLQKFDNDLRVKLQAVGSSTRQEFRGDSQKALSEGNNRLNAIVTDAISSAPEDIRPALNKRSASTFKTVFNDFSSGVESDKLDDALTSQIEIEQDAVDVVQDSTDSQEYLESLARLDASLETGRGLRSPGNFEKNRKKQLRDATKGFTDNVLPNTPEFLKLMVEAKQFDGILSPSEQAKLVDEANGAVLKNAQREQVESGLTFVGASKEITQAIRLKKIDLSNVSSAINLLEGAQPLRDAKAEKGRQANIRTFKNIRRALLTRLDPVILEDPIAKEEAIASAKLLKSKLKSRETVAETLLDLHDMKEKFSKLWVDGKINSKTYAEYDNLLSNSFNIFAAGGTQFFNESPLEAGIERITELTSGDLVNKVAMIDDYLDRFSRLKDQKENGEEVTNDEANQIGRDVFKARFSPLLDFNIIPKEGKVILSSSGEELRVFPDGSFS